MGHTQCVRLYRVLSPLALSLLVALKATHELGGAISLSGWIPRKGRDVSHTIEHCRP